ncbi:SpoIID/LytB domain-containing protein [Anaerocolumna cellulosilytica]|nr:SpoIID/LytB domain-containing protein [Anaerocolumna cellulosilytica]MBB5194497.1 stage II sporulation protein D [Anaerocolumna cellulosilytica]
MKKKLWLMGICIIILSLIFIGNIYKQITGDGNGKSDDYIYREETMLTVEEAEGLLKYLGIGQGELKFEKGEEYLTFLQGKKGLDLLANKYKFDVEAVKSKLSFDFSTVPENKIMLIEEFMNLYEGVIKALPENEKVVELKELYVLGINESEQEERLPLLITDQGVFSYLTLYGDKKVAKDFKSYVDSKLEVFIKGSEILYIKGVLNETTTLHNVFITNGSDSTVSVFLNGIERDFETKYKLSQNIEEVVADIVIQDKRIIKVSLKPDTIGGKVLVANEKYIEIEGYGKVNLDNYYRIYKVYGDLSMEVTNGILVGYKATDFVVADGKIVAALIKEPITAENIRVLIKTDNFKSLFHEKVQFTSDKPFTITAGDTTKSYKAGEKITIKPTNKLLKKGRLRIESSSENAKFQVLSVARSDNTPAYRGVLEIALEDEGLTLINELSIEEYLYAVIPSEMPTYYGLEPLKVQAICARSYAYNQLLANSYSRYGAHVDDSVSYQVYNNIPENEDSILAVKDTFGKVMRYENQVITAYYFSTSYGHTASIKEVWGGSGDINYLIGKLQTVYSVNHQDSFKTSDDETMPVSNNTSQEVDLSTDKAFRNFLKNDKIKTYDSEFAWYRWSVTIAKEDLKKSIDKSLASRYQANPALIQTLTGGSVDSKPQYESKPVNTIGNIVDIKVGKREKSGILSELILIGSDCTIKVQTEYNIRTLLAPLFDDVVRQDESTASGLSMLPSAYFVMDKKKGSIVFQGGGYGHGVGMSQNGVKAMADSGKSYEEILKHYYTGVEISIIY